MPRLTFSPIQRLREDLEDVLVQEDALDLLLVAIKKIKDALKQLMPREDGQVSQAR